MTTQKLTPSEAADSIGIGVVVSIHTAPGAGEPIVARDRVQAVAGVGLEGDRYAARAGNWSPVAGVDRDITLIEAEVIEDLATTDGIALAPGTTRRNVTTRGIRLNELVGRRFRIGDVICEATRLCEPCQYLTDLLGKPVLRPLVHRGGLRARILEGGEIAVGVEIAALD